MLPIITKCPSTSVYVQSVWKASKRKTSFFKCKFLIIRNIEASALYHTFLGARATHSQSQFHSSAIKRKDDALQIGTVKH